MMVQDFKKSVPRDLTQMGASSVSLLEMASVDVVSRNSIINRANNCSSLYSFDKQRDRDNLMYKQS